MMPRSINAVKGASASLQRHLTPLQLLPIALNSDHLSLLVFNCFGIALHFALLKVTITLTMPPKSRSKAQARRKKEETPTSEDSQAPDLNPYELLHLTSDATQGEIKTAYKKLALHCHPGMPKIVQVAGKTGILTV